jgi:Zn-dependent protease
LPGWRSRGKLDFFQALVELAFLQRNRVVFSMHEHHSWSLKLGRWGNVQVRLHMLFVLFAACTIYFGLTPAALHESIAAEVWLAIEILGVLLACVLLHEWGHVVAANRVGAFVEQIVLGPLGGLTSYRGLRDPVAELTVHLGGPIANFLGCLICLPLLLLLATTESPTTEIVGLLNPLRPLGIGNGSTLVVLVKAAFWVNWVLLLVNLLPAFPFDGGPIARSVLLLRWPRLGRRTASLLVGTMAKVIALLLVVLPFVLSSSTPSDLIDLRFPVVLLGILLFFSARHEERREAVREVEQDLLREFDITADMDELERELAESTARPTGPLKRWLDRRRDVRRQRQLEREEEEERCVDEILARLHHEGMNALSPHDRALLQRVSERYRERQRQ